MDVRLPERLILKQGALLCDAENCYAALDRPLLPSDCGEKRRMQFLSGRAFAREAMGALGFFANVALPRAAYGGVQWPSEVVGSIAHSADRAVALVGSATEYQSVGVDIENLARVRRPQIAERICTAVEQRMLFELTAAERHRWLIAIFSAKESLFKLLNPITGVFFGFQDAECDSIDNPQCINLTLRRELSPDIGVGFPVTVQLEFNDEFVISACWINRVGRFARL